MLKQRYQREASALSLYRPSGCHQKVLRLMKEKCLSPSVKVQSFIKNLQLETSQLAKNSIVSSPTSDINIPGSEMDYDQSDTGFVIESIPDLPEVFSSKFRPIFVRKVKLCRQRCNFNKFHNIQNNNNNNVSFEFQSINSAPSKLGTPSKRSTSSQPALKTFTASQKNILTKDEAAINCKTAALTDILQIFSGSTPPTTSMDDDLIFMLVDMLRVNIIRKLPSIEKRNLFFDDLPPLSDPAWPHLSIVYQILNRLVLCIPCSDYFGLDFLKSFIPIFDTADPNERAQIIQIFNNVLNNNFKLAMPILCEFEKVLMDYINSENMVPFRVSTILPIIHQILDTSPMQTPLYNRVFVNSIIPLLTDRYMMTFNHQLHKIIFYFIDDNSNLAKRVVEQIVKKWPCNQSAKQIFYINLLNESLSKMSYREIQKSIRPAFLLIRNGIMSLHEKVALSALSVYSKIEMDRIIADNAKVILPIIIPSLIKAVSSHWSQQVRQSAKLTLNILSKYDKKLTNEYLAHNNLIEAMHTKNSNKSWMSVIQSAQNNHESYDATSKIKEVSETFVDKTEFKTPIFLRQERRPRAYSISGTLPKLI